MEPLLPEHRFRNQYDSFCLMMTWMDAHFTRGDDDNPNDENEVFAAFCKTYKAFENACDHETKGSLGKDGTGAFDGLAGYQKLLGYEPRPHLLKPRAWMSLGRPDMLAMALTDDIDQTQWLMACTGRTIEEASLAFCLKTNALVQIYPSLDKHLCSVEELFSDPNAGQKRPLLLLIRLKLEGLPLLMDPVEVQASILDVICSRIQKCWLDLQGMSKSPLFDNTVLGTDAWRLCLLDLQEEEEIGLLFTCTNLSIPATFLKAIRGLTLGDLCRENESFQRLWSYHGEGLILAMKNLAEHSVGQVPDSINSPDPMCGHVFRWTRSSAAMDFETCQQVASGEDKCPPCEMRGKVATLIQAQVPCGHSSPAAGQARCSDTIKPSSNLNCLPCLIGSVDMVTGSVVNQASSKDDLQWLEDSAYFDTQMLPRQFAEFCKKMKGHWPTRQISGWSTSLVIPVPKELRVVHFTDYNEVTEKHYPYLLEAMKNAIQAIFSVNDELSGNAYWLRDRMQLSGLPISLRRAFMVLVEKYRSLARHPMRYDAVLDLYDSMSTLRVVLQDLLPKMLAPNKNAYGSHLVPRLGGTSVGFLFSYAKAVENAMHLRLRRSFPEGAPPEWDLDFRGPMSQIVVAGEAVLRSAIGIVRRNVLGDGNSFSRLGVANQIGVSGQIIHHMGTLGFEKKARLSYLETDVAHMTHLTHIADYFHEAFHLIYEEMRLLDLEPENLEQQPSEKKDNHLARNISQRLASLDGDPGNTAAEEKVDEILSESFVALMMLLTVADGDINLLWAHQGNVFASHPQSAYQPLSEDVPLSKKVETLRRLHRQYAKTFIPIGIIHALIEPLIRQYNGDTQKIMTALVNMHVEGETPEIISLSEARIVFENGCRLMAELLPEDFPVRVEPNSNTGEGEFPFWKPDVMHEFEDLWTRFNGCFMLENIWSAAMEVFGCFIADTVEASGEAAHMDDPRDHSQLYALWSKTTEFMDQELKMAMDGESNSPVSITAIFSKALNLNRNTIKVPGAASQETHPPSLGTTFVMRALHWAWKNYLPKPSDAETEWRLPRSIDWYGDTPKVVNKINELVRPIKLGKTKYADYLIDSIRPDGFCVSPDARAKRLIHQVHFIKSLWGISAVIRRRRFLTLISLSQKKQRRIQNEKF